MLDNTIKEQLNSIFAGLRSDIKFEMQTQEDDRRSASMLEFLHDVPLLLPSFRPIRNMAIAKLLHSKL